MRRPPTSVSPERPGGSSPTAAAKSGGLPAPGTTAPTVPWPELQRYLAGNFRQGDHVAIIGPTGTGKTHLALEVADLRTYVLVVACKPKDPLIEETRARGYHLIEGNVLEVPYTDGRPLYPRLVYWPRLPDRTARPVARDQRHEVGVVLPALLLEAALYGDAP